MTSAKKNALLIAYNDLNNSGVPNVIYQTIKALHEEFNFDIVVFDNNLFYYNKLIDEGINNISIINMHNEKSNNKLSRINYELFSNPRFVHKQTKQLFKEKDYVLIHSFKEYDSWPLLKVAKKFGIKKRILHSNVIHSEQKYMFLVRRNRRRTLRYGTEFIGVTRDACEKAWPKKNCQVIHFSYDSSKYHHSHCILDDKELVLTQIGTYSINKNQLFSIEVIKELRKIYPNVKLKLIGSERQEGYFSKMKEAIETSNLSESIEIINGSTNVEKQIPTTTFYLLPSLYEGASLVAVEGQACGIKVFASKGVPQEMNLGGITYLDLNDGPKKWAEAIYEEFKKSGNSRTAYDTTSFSAESFKNNLLKLYNK